MYRKLSAFLSVPSTLAFVVLLATFSIALAESESLTTQPVLEQVQPWSPDVRASPETSRNGDVAVVIDANGTKTCCGGWQFAYTNVQGGQGYRVRTRVQHEGLSVPRDCLAAIALWDTWDPTAKSTGQRPWNYLLPINATDKVTQFEAVLRAPTDASRLTIRYIFRWSPTGSSTWTTPQIEPVPLVKRQPVKLCVVTSPRKTREQTEICSFCDTARLPEDVAVSVNLWATLIDKACEQKPNLIVTPEIAIGGKDLIDGAIVVPGPATEPFQKLARQHSVHLVLGVRERDGDAVYNSAVLVTPDGQIGGVYRKVHLAISEGLSGTSAGDSFPIFDTAIGRIGCLICMDTTVSESARMLALGGAEIICFPIMGDLRASRWVPGSPMFDEDRWRAIMRTRAIDNQACMVIARNNVQGSCVIDRRGDILAWNEGDEQAIFATLPAEDGYRVWNGGDFREVTFLLRRPHLYNAYIDTNNVGPTKRQTVEADDPGRIGPRR